MYNRSLIRRVAKMHDLTEEQVKRDMQSALNYFQIENNKASHTNIKAQTVDEYLTQNVNDVIKIYKRNKS